MSADTVDFPISVGKSHFGSANSNWRGGAIRKCIGCGSEFKSYQKTRKYCSPECYIRNRIITPELRQKYSEAGKKGGGKHSLALGRNLVCKKCGCKFRHASKRRYCDEHRAEAKKLGQLRRAAATIRLFNRQCQQCGAGFHANDKSIRKYCSYQCFIDSGGALRAGLSAKRAASVYGAKKDANHRDVVNILRKTGTPFIDMSALGCGIPDLVVQVAGLLELWEVKNPKTSYGKRGLNKNQQAFANAWKGNSVRIIRTVDEALHALGIST